MTPEAGIPLDRRTERRLSWLLFGLCLIVALAIAALERQAERGGPPGKLELLQRRLASMPADRGRPGPGPP